MKKLLAALTATAALSLAVVGCGSSAEPAPEPKATSSAPAAPSDDVELDPDVLFNLAWDQMTPDDRSTVCTALETYGWDFVRDGMETGADGLDMSSMETPLRAACADAT